MQRGHKAPFLYFPFSERSVITVVCLLHIPSASSSGRYIPHKNLSASEICPSSSISGDSIMHVVIIRIWTFIEKIGCYGKLGVPIKSSRLLLRCFGTSKLALRKTRAICSFANIYQLFRLNSFELLFSRRYQTQIIISAERVRS